MRCVWIECQNFNLFFTAKLKSPSPVAIQTGTSPVDIEMGSDSYSQSEMLELGKYNFFKPQHDQIAS